MFFCCVFYIISCDPTDLSRQADGFVGKLRSNVFGTTFFVYDNGSKTNQDELRQDMAVVVYVRDCVVTFGLSKSKMKHEFDSNVSFQDRENERISFFFLVLSIVFRIQIFWVSKGRAT